MTGYFLFILNLARKAQGGRVSMLSATTPEAPEALRERMGSVKRRMAELELEDEKKQGRSGSGSSQSVSA